MVKAKKKLAKKRVARQKPKEVILPTKMSALIGIALKDLRKVEKAKNMAVDMSNWFDPNQTVRCETEGGTVLDEYEVCTLCFAGSVMAFSLGQAKSTKRLAPENFPKNKRQLYALNELREGNVLSAARVLHSKDGLSEGELSDAGLNVELLRKLDAFIPDYDAKEPEPFHKAMAKLQTTLRKAGL